jgi:hypothetical protein
MSNIPINKENKTVLQSVIEQIGDSIINKSIPMGARIGRCQLHGAYLILGGNEPNCPICPSLPSANGTDATEVEHYIDINQSINPQHNPGQLTNPYGV